MGPLTGHKAITIRTGIGRIQRTTLSRVVNRHIFFHAEPLDGRSSGFPDFWVQDVGAGRMLVAYSGFTQHHRWKEDRTDVDPETIGNATLESLTIQLGCLKAFAERE